MKAIPKSALAMLFIVAPALVNSEDVQDELTGAYMGGAVVTINLDTRQHTADKAARVAVQKDVYASFRAPCAVQF